MSGNVTIHVFDAYGTLFDVHSAVQQHAADLGNDAAGISALWRERQLHYTWVRTLADDYRDFARVTRDALDHALLRHEIRDDRLRERLLAAYRHLDAYPGVADVLRDIKDQGAQTAVFSNATRAMLVDALKHAGLSTLVDHVVTVDDIGIYKPAAAAYVHAETSLDCDPADIRFYSSNAWDIHGARMHGWSVCWVNRNGYPAEFDDNDILICASLRQAVTLAT